MKKALALVFIFAAIFTITRFWKEKGSLSEVVNSPETQTPLKTPLKMTKKVHQKNNPKDTQRQLQKKAPHKRHLKNKNDVLKSVESRHLANTDERGVIYPTKLLVDEDFIIAYGDLIVGHSRYLNEYQDGEKEITLPPPRIWPRGIIPYKHEGITKEQQTAIREISSQLKGKADIMLIPYDESHQSWVLFKEGGQNCYAEVGFAKGERSISLNEKCNFEAIFHELFHILGFYHEQNRFDRDEHLQIIWENIDEEHWPQFEKFSKRSFPQILQKSTFSTNSFMLYPPTAFSNTQDYSIVTREGIPYSSPKLPSDVDYQRLKNLYYNEIKARH